MGAVLRCNYYLPIQKSMATHIQAILTFAERTKRQQGQRDTCAHANPQKGQRIVPKLTVSSCFHCKCRGLWGWRCVRGGVFLLCVCLRGVICRRSKEFLKQNKTTFILPLIRLGTFVYFTIQITSTLEYSLE